MPQDPAQRPYVLLLQPRFGDWEKIEGIMPPLGLLHVARGLRPDCDVTLLDHRCHGRRWPAVLHAALVRRPVLVGLTSIVGPSIADSLEMADEVWRIWPGVPIIWGGVAASLLAAVALRDARVTAVVHGQGDGVLREIVQAIELDQPLDTVAGLSIRGQDGAILRTRERAPVQRSDLAELPYDLVDMPFYLRQYRGGGWLPMVSSFGCPCDCTFCYSPGLHHRRWRPVPADRVIADVQAAIARWGVRNIQFLDDNFFADRRRALAIAAGLAPLGVQWMAHGLTILDANRLTDADLALIAASGCVELGSGIESGADSTLTAIRKPNSVEEALAVNRRLARLPLAVTYGLVVGFPGETDAEIKQTIDIARQLMDENPQADVKHIAPLLPLPGSALFDVAVAMGFEPPENWRQWGDYEATKAKVPWLDDRQRRRLDALFFCSIFLRRGKLQRHGIGGPLPWLVDNLYSPIANWRVNTGNYGWMWELEVKKVVERLWPTRQG